MASRVSVRVVKNDLPRIASQLPVARRVILGKRGKEMKAIAQQRSRYDTGEMHDGWEVVETNAGILLKNDVGHTIHNEYGTVNMPAQPMARPAHEQVAPKIINDFRNLEERLG